MRYIKTAKSFIGRVLREATVHTKRIVQKPNLPRILFMIDGPRDGFASGLRGWAVADRMKAMGWRVTALPQHLSRAQRERIIALESPNVILFQKARHPLHLPELCGKIPFVIDLDDADFLDPAQEPMLRRFARESIGCIAGSRFVANWLSESSGDVTTIWTAFPHKLAFRDSLSREKVIVWACSSPQLYSCEARFVQAVLLNLAKRNVDCNFWLIGSPDEQWAEDWLAPVRSAGITCQAFGFMKYRRLLKLLNGAAIGLAPLDVNGNPYSAGKSFGKVLAYLATGVAVIASDEADYSLFFKARNNGVIVNNDVNIWTEQVELLLSNPTHRQSLVTQATLDCSQKLSIEAAAKRLDQFLRELIDGSKGVDRTEQKAR